MTFALPAAVCGRCKLTAVPIPTAAAARAPALHALALFLIFSAVYLPDVGHGFVKDDFAWIHHGRIDSLASVPDVLQRAVGFYRPIVTLSFGLNELVFGRRSLGYGLTNFALAAASAGLLYALARRFGLTAWGALSVSGLWAFNFHGVNMAVLWLSGRTALLLTLFSLLAALAALSGRGLLVFIFTLLALGSKEEAVVLPAVLFAVTAARHQSLIADWRRRMATAVLPSTAALAVYLALRAQSDAFTPQSAPSYYRLAFDLPALVGNILQYADRAATLSVAAMLLTWLSVRRRPALGGAERTLLLIGGVWLASGFAITVWLPVRSSLYALWPSIGICLAAGVVLDALVARMTDVQRRRVAVAALVLPLVLLPVYRARNVRWVELGDLTSATVAAIDAATQSLAPGTLIELRDDRSTRASFQNAIGTLYAEAAQVYFDGTYELWIEPPPPEIAAAGVSRPAAERTAVFALRDGTVRRLH